MEGDHYLTATTAAQQDMVEQIIEDAQQDMLRRAAPAVVLTDAGVSDLAGRYPELISRLGVDDTAIAELDRRDPRCVRGRLRRPAVGPARPARQAMPGPAVGVPALPAGGVRPPARGEPAAAQGVLRPAVAADARAQFMAVFGPYAARIGQVLHRYPAQLLAALAAEVGDHDGELPLRAEELTW